MSRQLDSYPQKGNSMKPLLSMLVATWGLAFAPAFGQVVVENDNVVYGDSLNKLSFSVYKEAEIGDVNFTVANFTLSGSELKFDGGSLDEGSSWYAVQPGDLFSPQTIASGEFTPLVTFGPMSYPAVNVGAGDFYLGIRTFSLNAPGKSAFGWVHLNSDGTELASHATMVSNAMSYGSRGIIVGTTILVPEPYGLAMVAGLGVVASSQRVSRRLRRPQG
jgi:hypothetical protein